MRPVQAMKTCSICASPSHPTDVYPTLQQNDSSNFTNRTATAANVFSNKPRYYQPQQNRYDSLFNTYNSSWRDHPNFRYENVQQ